MLAYKDYHCSMIKNDYGYYEAINQIDCDAYVLTGKTIVELIEQIDHEI